MFDMFSVFVMFSVFNIQCVDLFSVFNTFDVFNMFNACVRNRRLVGTLHQVVGAATRSLLITQENDTHLMLREPPICWLGRTVHRSLHVPVVGGLVATRTVAPPPVLATGIDLIVECVIDCDVRPRYGLHIFKGCYPRC